MNSRGVDLYQRQYYHTFKALVNNQNFDHSIILECKELEGFLVSQKDKVMVFDINNYNIKMTIHLPPKESEITGMQLCQED
jgi:hypothetical protein